ncbi:hypothetical protein [Phaeodactylibacter xiamenensis]|uniref:hypothetical protein n=1 Tax=Phaeodactylibacter xiamenensis TaxID=1524460 RepID=UPI003CCC0C3A
MNQENHLLRNISRIAAAATAPPAAAPVALPPLAAATAAVVAAVAIFLGVEKDEQCDGCDYSKHDDKICFVLRCGLIFHLIRLKRLKRRLT